MGISLKDAISYSHHYNDGTKDFNTIVNDADDYFFDTYANGKNKKHLSSWQGYMYRSNVYVAPLDGNYVFDFPGTRTTIRKNLGCDYEFSQGSRSFFYVDSANLDTSFSGSNGSSNDKLKWEISGVLNGHNSYIDITVPNNTTGQYLERTINLSTNGIFPIVDLPCVGPVRITVDDITIKQAPLATYRIPVYLRIGPRNSEVQGNYENSQYATAIECDFEINGNHESYREDNYNGLAYYLDSNLMTKIEKYVMSYQPICVLEVDSSTPTLSSIDLKISMVGAKGYYSGTFFQDADVGIYYTNDTWPGVSSLMEDLAQYRLSDMSYFTEITAGGCKIIPFESYYDEGIDDGLLAHWRESLGSNSHDVNITHSGDIGLTAYKDYDYMNSSSDMNGSAIIINIDLY